jgi:TRAP-type C4-dicarboxylate transport system permease small subunit
VRAVVDFFALALMAVFASVISWKIWTLVVDSLESDIRSSTYLLTPLYIPQGILGVGFSLLALAALVSAVAALVGRKLPAAAPALERSAAQPAEQQAR